MKITFIGSSHGMPMPHRNCQCIMIEAGQKAYLVDVGGPAINWMVDNNFEKEKLKAVFVTHMHGDHTNDLLNLTDLATWCYRTMDFDVFLPEQRGIAPFEAMLKMNNINSDVYPNDRIRFKAIENKNVYEDDTIKVTAYPTEHMHNGTLPAYGYLIESMGKKVYISGDLHGTLRDYPEITNQIELDAFIVECAHFPFPELQKRLENTKAKNVLITHVHPQSKFDEINEYIKTAKVETVAVNDNDWFEI